jgi:hypothetical protein
MENNDLVTRMADACGLSEEDTQRLQNAFEQLAQAIHDVCDAIVEVIRKVANWLVETLSLVDWQDEVCRATLSNKQYHLCKHAKKARTRKKYQNLAFRRFSYAN